MYHLLRLISVRRVRQRLGHVLHAVAAVMVGVGAIVAVQLMTTAISDGIVRSLDAFTGRTVLRVDAGEAGLPESVLDAVRAVPGVEVAVPILTSPAYVVGTPGEVLTVIGIDLSEEDRVRRYRAEGRDDAVVEDPLTVAQRGEEIALLRVLGVRRRDSVRLILLEAGVIGVVGACAGLGFGVTLARVLLRSVDHAQYGALHRARPVGARSASRA